MYWKWINMYWWKYLFTKPCTWRKFWCRAKGHPCGPWYYCSGPEPDMKCKNCDDEL